MYSDNNEVEMFDNDSYDPQVIYREVQGFNHPAMWILIAVIDIVIIGNIVLMYLVQKKLIPSKPGDDLSATSFAVISGLLIIFMLFLNWFLISLKLITEIRIDYLFIHLYPGFKRKIEYSDVSKIETDSQYSFLRGGWGYHLAPGWRCYNAPGGGKTAIQITRKDNIKIIISSREQDMVVKQIRDAARTYGVNL
jgi:hypothetical protein